MDFSPCLIQGYTAAQLAPDTIQKLLRDDADLAATAGGTDVDLQLLDAAKAGDLDVCKVRWCLGFEQYSNNDNGDGDNHHHHHQ